MLAGWSRYGWRKSETNEYDRLGKMKTIEIERSLQADVLYMTRNYASTMYGSILTSAHRCDGICWSLGSFNYFLPEMVVYL